MKKKALTFTALLMVVLMAFVFTGCDTGTNDDNGGNGGGSSGATSVPEELRGKWYEIERFDDVDAEPEYADLTFSEDRMYIGDPDSFSMALLVKITGTKIEYTTSEEAAQAGLWQTFCTSYTISSNVLTPAGGINDGQEYKRKDP